MSKERIVLGSGKLYITEFDGKTVPELEELCKDENILGYIKGGATLSYTPTFLEVKDDLGTHTKTIITEEEAALTSGIMTFDGDTLKTLCETARVEEDKAKGLRIVKFGGIGNASGKRYVICFHHEDKIDGDIDVIIVGKNTAGFSLAFAKDAETVIDAEFKALAQDNEGTLIKYIEHDASLKTQSTQNAAGSKKAAVSE